MAGAVPPSTGCQWTGTLTRLVDTNCYELTEQREPRGPLGGPCPNCLL